MKHLALITLLTVCCTGCTVPYFKSTQGTLTTAGVSLPNSEIMNFQIASYLSGQQITVKENSKKITYSWNTSETNSYFGLIKTGANRNGKITIDGK